MHRGPGRIMVRLGRNRDRGAGRARDLPSGLPPGDL